MVLVIALALGHSGPSMSMSMPMSSAASAKANASAASIVVAGKTARLKIANYSFVPAKMTVTVGTKITVTNVDATAHTVTARSGAFDTGTVNPGKTKTFTVTRAGTYPYYCQFHAFMTGMLTVVK